MNQNIIIRNKVSMEISDFEVINCNILAFRQFYNFNVIYALCRTILQSNHIAGLQQLCTCPTLSLYPERMVFCRFDDFFINRQIEYRIGYMNIGIDNRLVRNFSRFRICRKNQISNLNFFDRTVTIRCFDHRTRSKTACIELAV